MAPTSNLVYLTVANLDGDRLYPVDWVLAAKFPCTTRMVRILSSEFVRGRHSTAGQASICQAGTNFHTIHSKVIVPLPSFLFNAHTFIKLHFALIPILEGHIC